MICFYKWAFCLFLKQNVSDKQLIMAKICENKFIQIEKGTNNVYQQM